MSASGSSLALEAVFGGMTASTLALSDLPPLTAREPSKTAGRAAVLRVGEDGGSPSNPDDPAFRVACGGSMSLGSMSQAVGHDAAVLGELRHHGAVQRDVLFRRAIGAGMHVELVGQLLARR